MAGYVPHHRLQRADIRGVLGKGGGKGTRSVASYDEDTTTMGVEAGRLALRSAGDVRPDRLWFATSAPAYLDKTNATAVHAALRLDSSALAMDAGGAIRSGIGALRSALESSGTTLVVTADLRSGRPSSAEESAGGDGAAAAARGRRRRSSPSTSAAPRSPTSSWSVGAGPATGTPGPGRTASASRSTRTSVARPGMRRSRRPRSPPAT